MKRFQVGLSVRWLMALVALVACWCAWKRQINSALAAEHARNEAHYADMAAHRTRTAAKLSGQAVAPNNWDRLVAWGGIEVIDKRSAVTVAAEAKEFANLATIEGQLKRHYQNRWW